MTGKPRHVRRRKLLALAISTLSRKYAGRGLTGPGDQDGSSHSVTFLLAATYQKSRLRIDTTTYLDEYCTLPGESVRIEKKGFREQSL